MKALVVFLKNTLLLILCLIVAVVGAHLTARQDLKGAQSVPVSVDKSQPAYDRVLKSGHLRCGYIVLPPQLIRDPNTGAFSGVTYDLLEEAASRLKLKVDWVEEVTFPTMAEGLKTGRYDAFCLTAYRWLPAAYLMDYTSPIFYSATVPYVRADDTRFDADLAAANNENVTVATVDGEAAHFIKEQSFPRAKSYSLPQNADVSTMFEAVTTKKADVTFANPLMAMPYLVAHPGVLKAVHQDKPLRYFVHAFAFGKGEAKLLTLFDMAVDDMRDDGTLDRILDKYESIPGSFLRIKPMGR